MLTLYCLTLIGLLPSHHTSTPAQPCCTQLKTPVLYAQSSRLAEPGLRHYTTTGASEVDGTSSPPTLSPGPEPVGTSVGGVDPGGKQSSIVTSAGSLFAASYSLN